MTEQEWLTAVDPWPMLNWIWDNASDRKLRLFAVACCRRRWESITDERSRHAVEVAECYADNSDLEGELDRACSASLEAAREVYQEPANFLEIDLPAILPTLAACLGRHQVAFVADYSQGFPPNNPHAKAVEARAQAQLVRDLFGNPFAPPAVDPAWLTSTVLTLANDIYDGKTFDRLPILADALADAGCDSDDLLSHCRGDGPHVRGCWAVDLLLGRQ